MKSKFTLVSKFKPSSEQAKAIKSLLQGIRENKKNQVLLGVTGSGKTFTVANVIAQCQRQVLVIVHNKTLAMQLYTEIKGLFPENRVEYFVSNFDFYQPEAYVPQRDVYISKDVRHNLELDMMRLSATNALSTRGDTIVVASVAAIFAAQDPHEYAESFLELAVNTKVTREELLRFLVNAGYKRNDYELEAGQFTAKGNVIKIAPAYISKGYVRLDLWDDQVHGIAMVDFINGYVLKQLTRVTIFPAQAYITKEERRTEALERIKEELAEQYAALVEQEQPLLAKRLKVRTENDLENLAEYGYCTGIENYTRHLNLKGPGEKPCTLLDYFQDDFIIIVDESHMTLPQIRGMYNTNLSRKKTLIEYGFRLPSALDNRPLHFEEFMKSLHQAIYVSATPGDYELDLTNQQVVEQIVRPTGLVDPTIEVLPTMGQLDRVISIIRSTVEKKYRVLIVTLTKRMSEELTNYLHKYHVKAVYLHSDLKTLERSEVINDLRRGVYDCLIGVNLLREGIDIPEIASICILDANKQGFLRDRRSLIQIIGRAARNIHGKVYMFADSVSSAMKEAIEETQRRRDMQLAYNNKHNITPRSIIKPVVNTVEDSDELKSVIRLAKSKKPNKIKLKATIKRLRGEMQVASRAMNFDKAAKIRDVLIELNQRLESLK